MIDPDTFGGVMFACHHETHKTAVVELRRETDCPQPGTVWQHYKGGIYTVLGASPWVGRFASEPDPDRLGVVYIGARGGHVWWRPVREWGEPVTVLGGVERPRFALRMGGAE